MKHYYLNDNQFGKDNWFTYPKLYTRFAKECGDLPRIVEVGSWTGRSIAFLGVEIINQQKPAQLWCVDTWYGKPEIANQVPGVILNNDTHFQTFLQNISPLGHMVFAVRKLSIEAAKDFPDSFLDAVFIDADHEYESVKADMEAWYPKVKAGGFFCGHDYPGWPGVVKAVNEFFASHPELKLEISEGCWISRKPL